MESDMELERFFRAKQAEIAALENGGLDALEPWQAARPSFPAALRSPGTAPLPVIAEYKKASPSRGLLCGSIEPEEAARQYAENGAAALSVLTEERWFMGHIGYLARIAAMMQEKQVRPLPMLRKDFIFHPAQVSATLATPASAMLLIVRLAPDARVLRDLREQAERGGVEAVVEVFNPGDVAIARDSGAHIIQVNARDLETFRIDVTAALRVIEAFPPQGDELWIAASGMSSHEDLLAAAAAGYHAALVGSALMEGGAPGHALRCMLTGCAGGGSGRC